jgi:hypothetical protein
MAKQKEAALIEFHLEMDMLQRHAAGAREDGVKEVLMIQPQANDRAQIRVVLANDEYVEFPCSASGAVEAKGFVLGFSLGRKFA